MIKILLVEDDLTFSTMLSCWLRKKGFDVRTASGVGEALKALREEDSHIDLVLSDYRMPDHSGLDLLHHMQDLHLNLPFIVMTSYADVSSAVTAMKSGATDYLAKPVQPDILLGKIHEALAQKKTATAHRQPATDPPPTEKSASRDTTASPQAAGIEGSSATARELYRLAALVAPTHMSVLIIGASGTGKEFVAHRIHEQSANRHGPFVALDCGALTKELAASELFGHVKGAFTGATDDKRGVFEQANGGTLFLDEVGNLSYDVQVQLLRALQERRIRPVGGSTERPVTLRLICATNENLPEAVARGTYREDLYHRINEFTLYMPLLRERSDDIMEFARYFLTKANAELQRTVSGFSADAQQAMMRYAWPGNLREMKNAVVRAALLADTRAIITAADLNLGNDTIGRGQSADPEPAVTLRPTADDERARIQAALDRTGGNKSRAAQLLGIDRKTLYNKLKNFEADL